MGMTDKQFNAYVRSIQDQLQEALELLKSVEHLKDDPNLVKVEEKLSRLDNSFKQALED